MHKSAAHAVIATNQHWLATAVHAFPRLLRVDRRVGVIDVALFITAVLMLTSHLTALLFHFIFILLTLGAFCWTLHRFIVRTFVWVGIASIGIVQAVMFGRSAAEELVEIPMQTAMVLLVFLIAAQRARVETELAHHSLHDALTRLPNRTLFVSRLDEALSLNGSRNETFAVLYVDLDGFKDVNDRLGHAAGDTLLAEIAGRLNGLVRLTDTVARIGGDEFALILRETSPDGARAAAERIVASIQQPVSIQGHAVAVSASVGFALCAPRQQARADELLHHADAAMYRAKTRKLDRRAAIVPSPVL